MSEKMNIGVYLFDNMTMLDGYGPLQILSMVEPFNTFTFAKEQRPVNSDCGAMLTPHYDFSNCPPLDILIVPGGGNVFSEMQDEVVQSHLKQVGEQAKYITSVCTGALILAEAGLYDGYKATTHWSALEALNMYPEIEALDQRVVVDRNRISGGGITAGIDFALTLIAEVVNPQMAQVMQLIFEYRPQPPFDSGSPQTAPAEVMAVVQGLVEEHSGEMFAYIKDKYAA